MAFSKVILNDEVLMDVTDDTVAETNLLYGEQATGNDGEKVEGSIATKTASDLTVSGATVTVPAGYYASQASKSVSTTTHPEPTVSVNSSTGLVTASHTQTTGYVTGGTTTKEYVLAAQGGKTVTPTETEQTAVAKGLYTTGVVKVGAISSTYVGSDVPQNDSDDLTTSGRFVTAPAGYYAENAIKGVAVGSSIVNATLTVDPTISLTTTGNIIATTSGSASVTPTVSPGYVSAGTAGNINYSGSASLQLTTQAAKTVTPTESEQTAVAKNVYTTGIVKVGAISSTYVGSDIAQNDSDDLTASGATVTVPAGYYAEDASKTVASGSSTVSSTITISPTITVSDAGLITAKTNGSVGVKPTVTAGYISEGTTGTITYTGNSTTQLATQAAKTVTPTESSQTAVAAKRYTTGAVTVAAIPSTYVGSGITQRDSDDLTASGATVSVPAGYYSAAASKTIASGSARTPNILMSSAPTVSIDYSNATVTATVNAASGVTPVVTAGYISEGTEGTVKASGTKTSNISTQTQSVTPSGLEQVILPYENGSYAGALNYTAYCNSGSISHHINLVNGTTYIINSIITLQSDGAAETYDTVNYNSIVTWDGSWSPQNLPKGTASNYVKSLVLDSTTLTPVWYSSNDFSVQCNFYFSAFELSQSNAFLSQVTVQPIPRLADLVTLLNSYQIVTTDADMGEVYCSLEAFFSAIESGGYNFGVSLLESAGSNLLTDDAETLYGDRTIQKVNNGGGSYTINYQ